MRPILAILLASAPLAGQYLVNSARTEVIAKYFEPPKTEKRLRCEVFPIRPELNFSFRFQAGYVFRVPMSQFAGAGHRWNILTRVTPEPGGRPVYLRSYFRLPNVPKTKRSIEWGGVYWVGQGRYAVDWLLYDETNRVCRKQWNLEAKLSSSERGVAVGMEAGTVAQVSFRRWSPQETADVPVLHRLAVFLHAAPLFPGSIRFRAQDRIMLLGSLASLLESVPAQSVRLVIFNLDQQRELFRQDAFTPDAFDQAAQSMNNLQLQLVDYSVLKNRRGHVDLLADLLNQELKADEPADAVIFLGPPTRYYDKLAHTVLEERSGAGPQFFYLQHRPYLRRGGEVPDSIESALKKVRGRKFEIHTPEEFARAIKQVDSQLAALK